MHVWQVLAVLHIWQFATEHWIHVPPTNENPDAQAKQTLAALQVWQLMTEH